MSGVRPGDIVGAIANEANVSSRQIGAIDISDRFTLAEVDSAVAQQVIDALQGFASATPHHGEARPRCAARRTQ